MGETVRWKTTTRKCRKETERECVYEKQETEHERDSGRLKKRREVKGLQIWLEV